MQVSKGDYTYLALPRKTKEKIEKVVVKIPYFEVKNIWFE